VAAFRFWHRRRDGKNLEGGEHSQPPVEVPPVFELGSGRVFLEAGRFTIVPEKVDEGQLGVACVKGDKANADYLLVSENILIGGRQRRLYAVFDGVTLSDRPNVASGLASREFLADQPTEEDVVGFLGACFGRANAALLGVRGETTASVAVYDSASGDLTVGHVGDSRIYVVGGETRLLTEDHVGLKPAPFLQELSGGDYPLVRSILMRVVGGEADISPQIESCQVRRGEILCAMTDGVWGPLSLPAGYDADKASRGISAAFASAGTDTWLHPSIIRKYSEAPGRLDVALSDALKKSGGNLQTAAEALIRLSENASIFRQDDKTVILARL
jgi:serine/threonine protein phosphatase PrpC